MRTFLRAYDPAARDAVVDKGVLHRLALALVPTLQDHGVHGLRVRGVKRDELRLARFFHSFIVLSLVEVVLATVNLVFESQLPSLPSLCCR